MRKLIYLLPLVLLLGCAGEQIVVTPVNCNIYEVYGATPENSMIAAKISNPCLVADAIVIAAKIPAIHWKEKYADEFDVWANKIEAVLKDGISLSELRDIVVVEVSKLNEEAGLTILAISPIMNQFWEVGPMKSKDTEMLLGLVQRLRAEVAQMVIMAQ